MPEATTTPEIKISNNPEIQQKVEQGSKTISERYPNTDPKLVNEQARSRIATQIRLERIKKELRETRKTSITDNLTGALNNTGFEEIIQLEGRRTLRTQKPMVIVVLDANDLREINKSGHAVGDEYLKKIAEVLRKTSRASDILGRRSNSEETEESLNVARWGGDEFGVILDETDLEGAKTWWTRTADEFKNAGISIGAGMQILNPSDIAGKSPSEVSAIIADKKHEADLAMMGIAKPESKESKKPTLSVYNEIPVETRQMLPQIISQQVKTA